MPSDLGTSFSQIKRKAQPLLLAALHSVIQSFIRSYVDDFSKSHIGGRRLDSGPDFLFDTISTIAEKQKESKHTFFPTLMSILLLCPEAMGKIVLGNAAKTPTMARKAAFVAACKHDLRETGGSWTTSLACHADLFAAACLTEPNNRDPCALRILVADLEHDLYVSMTGPAFAQ